MVIFVAFVVSLCQFACQKKGATQVGATLNSSFDVQSFRGGLWSPKVLEDSAFQAQRLVCVSDLDTEDLKLRSLLERQNYLYFAAAPIPADLKSAVGSLLRSSVEKASQLSSVCTSTIGIRAALYRDPRIDFTGTFLSLEWAPGKQSFYLLTGVMTELAKPLAIEVETFEGEKDHERLMLPQTEFYPSLEGVFFPEGLGKSKGPYLNPVAQAVLKHRLSKITFYEPPRNDELWQQLKQKDPELGRLFEGLFQELTNHESFSGYLSELEKAVNFVSSKNQVSKNQALVSILDQWELRDGFSGPATLPVGMLSEKEFFSMIDLGRMFRDIIGNHGIFGHQIQMNVLMRIRSQRPELFSYQGRTLAVHEVVRLAVSNGVWVELFDLDWNSRSFRSPQFLGESGLLHQGLNDLAAAVRGNEL